MTVRLIEGQVPYTGGTAIEITADKVINLLLRAENNLLHVNDDNELYCDLQLENGIAVDDDLPVGVTTGIVNESDGRPQNGLLLHYETTSGAYAQWLYGGDGKLYFNGGTGERKLVYYAEDVDELLNQLYNQLVYELTMEAGEGISIVNGKDYSAMRGPCPEGFHIPMKSENDMLYDIVVGEFGLRDFETYLKMPIYGALKFDTGRPYGAESHYMSCNAQSVDHCYALGVQSNNVYRNLSVYKSNGQSIRPVSDHILKPTQHWTVIYDGSSIAEGAGIFHNLGLGVISLSSDGENWITIADKNLGATTVFNVGDPKTSDNCGGFFQWGNNYMFPSSGATQTDNNKVNASDYGPGNYYTSNTFILTDWTDWDSSNNANLWGGVTGVQNMHNVINNTGVLSVNGRRGHVIVADNVKIFNLEDNQDLDTAQEIFDWFDQGKYPVIYYDNNSYIFKDALQGALTFICSVPEGGEDVYQDNSIIKYKAIELFYTGSSVVNISFLSWVPSINYLDTDVDYRFPYVPQYDGSPATKKYVDDNVGLRIFPFADWSDLTTGQAAYDWYKSGKLPVLLHNNILYYPFQNSGGWLLFYPLELDHQTANGGHGQYSYYNRIRITINTTNDIVTAINASTRTPYGYRIDPNEDYQYPYMAQYDGSPVTKKYLDNRIISDSTAPASPTEGALWYDTTNDVLKSFNGTTWDEVGNESADINTKTFFLTGVTPDDLVTAQKAYDRFKAGKNPIIWSGSNEVYYYYNTRFFTGFKDVQFIKIKVDDQQMTSCTNLRQDVLAFRVDDTSDTVTQIVRQAYGTTGLLQEGKDYATPYIAEYNGSPATKLYVDQYGPCVPVYHLGGGNVMTSYINFDMAGGIYKVKIQGYHGTTINRTITVTASSTVQGTFTSNLMEHYNYGCIVTIDPSVSTTMIIQIDSNSNFTVDDIYIEKINIQSGIVTATSIN